MKYAMLMKIKEADKEVYEMIEKNDEVKLI